MRHFAAAVAVALVTLTKPADADDDAAKKLIGSWRLISFEVQVIGESTEHKDMLGPKPMLARSRIRLLDPKRLSALCQADAA